MSMSKKEYLALLQRSARNGTFPSINRKTGFCRLRMEGGRACAIGVLIPDEVWTPDDDDEIPRFLLRGKYAPYIPTGLSEENLLTVQEAHDYYASRTEGWNADAFIAEIRKRLFFADVLAEVPA